eukprot:1147865-Pelagomonas_calceolata.AAC.6
MSNAPASHEGEEELLDYEEEEVPEQDAGAGAKSGTEKKGYVGIHATGFKELMLKPELLQAITDCGFEHPSEGQQQTCPALPCLAHGSVITTLHAPPPCMV